VLLTNEQELEEVVVIGYGTQSRRTVTAAVASVSGEKFKDVPRANAEGALQGRASGVSIITRNGSVGEAPIVRVRGVSSITSGTEPLYVVDGIPIITGNVGYTINALADINPADILTMDVLKDAAAAALYGSRAANGVVLITTRKGQADKAKITYDGWVGVTQASKTIPVMNAQQYVEFKNMAVKNFFGTDERSLTAGYTSPFGNKAYNLWTLSDGSYVDQDWSKVIYQTGLQHNHSVSASGGSQKIQYYVSTNFTDQKGIISKEAYKRLGGAANITANATKWLSLGINLNATSSSSTYVDGGRSSQYSTKNFSRMALILPPNQPAYDPETGRAYYENNGAIGYGPNTVQIGYYNPQALLDFGEHYTSKVSRIISSYFAELKPIDGLSLKSQLGIDYMMVADDAFYTPYTGDAFPLGEADMRRTVRKATTWTNTAQYNFSVGSNNFNVLAGFETYETEYNRAGAYRDDILDKKFTVYQADYANTYPYSNDLSESALLSYLGRVNWDYNAKYMASVNFRRDGFSALSKNHRWGNFGGASAAWRISQEDFFEPLTNIVSDLKLKASWGIVGNTNIGAYASKSYYQSSYYGKEGQYYLSKIADSENLKWESSTKLDIGFTAQLFRNINIEFDYYKNSASDLILNLPVAWSKGIPGNNITTNVGSMTNTGIEFSISATPYQTNDFSWSTSFNITTQTNEVTALAEGVTEIRGDMDYNITLPGYSISQLYIRPSNGIDPETGKRIMIDKDGNEVLVDFRTQGGVQFLDRKTGETVSQSNLVQIIAGGTLPTYYGGWTNDFKYKNFDLSLLLQYSGGNWIYNGTTATMSDMRFWNNAIDVYEHAWRNVGDNAKYAKPIANDNYSNGTSLPITDWVERGDYLRFKTLTLGYTFNTKNWHKDVGVSNLRVYLAAQNLFCLTGYSGLDPESIISSTSEATLQGGVDKNALPQSKVYTIGLNVTF
jgi:TonB-linked SusC/RagA family outer membrane protein